MSATSAVVDGKMEPVQPSPIVRPLVVTGQYFYDNYVASDGSGTRMAWIRTYLVPNADAQQVKGALDEMVKIGHKADMLAGFDEKIKGPKRNTAMNIRSFVQSIYGALRFAPEQMASLGFDETTGWTESRVMALAALERANLVWSGQSRPNAIQKEQAALLRKNKAEMTAQIEATKATPRALNESAESWQARVNNIALGMVENARAEEQADEATKAFKKLVEKHDRSVLGAIANMLLEHLTEASAGQSEISEAEANALLAAAAEAGNVEIHEETEETAE